MYKEKILIVEDEMIVAKDVEYTIESLGYDSCGTSCRWDETIRLVEEGQPTLILMDIMLGENTDGIELGKYIWDNYQIPIIFVSAYTDKTTIKRAKRANPFGYLRKPFDEKELYLAIEMARYKYKKSKKENAEKDWVELTLSVLDKGIITIDCHQNIVLSNEVARSLINRQIKEIENELIHDIFEFENGVTEFQHEFKTNVMVKNSPDDIRLACTFKVIEGAERRGGVIIFD